MASGAGRVNCYIPRELKDEYRALYGAEADFAGILRRGVVEAVQRKRAELAEQPQAMAG